MKSNTRSLTLLLAALALLLCSCGPKDPHSEDAEPTTAELVAKAAGEQTAPSAPAQLPVRYQTPGFITADDPLDESLGEEMAEYEIKVGANIRSTSGPQPLWDILKRLANLKGMTVSWASDVDQNALVDVDINAMDNYFDAIDNLLRQVEYFKEVEGNTIVVKYKETRRFHVAVPFMKGTYTSTVGGNFLTDREAASGTEGTVKITSNENEFDVWENLKLNLDTILEVWSGRREAEQVTGIKEEEAAQAARTFQGTTQQSTSQLASNESQDTVKQDVQAITERAAQGYYTIDKSVGMVTVTAPRPIIEKVEDYLESLKKELYRQVVLEAKIIEVYLQDNSRIGLDWSQVLKNFDITGTIRFGGSPSNANDGQVYPWDEAIDSDTGDPFTRFVSKISLSPANFSVMLNALNEQGDATVLANPKVTVLNGQPAMISVGTDIAYIKQVSSEISKDTGTISYTAETDSVVDGISLGVMASIIDDESVILHLTPITTNLVGDEIEYKTFGADNLQIGLPKVKVREISTMVQVKNGEMLIIGGLIDSVEGKTGEFAPVVGNIPIIKYLFGVEEKRKEKRELVVLLTPRVI